MEIVWQLPVKQSNLTDHDWIHPFAKYHAYNVETNRSLCGKHGQDVSFFETTMPEGTGEDQMCKACLKKLGGGKELVIEESGIIGQLKYIQGIGNRTEHHLRNSLEMEALMKLEDDGLGHWTITQLLNQLQDMHTNGETELFYVLANRKKRV